MGSSFSERHVFQTSDIGFLRHMSASGRISTMVASKRFFFRLWVDADSLLQNDSLHSFHALYHILRTSFFRINRTISKLSGG